MGWTATDTVQQLDSNPSKDPTTIGAAFRAQAPMGTRHVDNFDDRVTYEASIYTNEPQALSRKQPNNVDADGVQVAQGSRLARRFMQSLNPTRNANVPVRSQVDAALVNVGNGGSFDETQVRPWAGFPLSGTSDVEQANKTNDVIGDTINTEWPYLVKPGERTISEQALDIPDRMSEHPTQSQEVRPWDVVMGAWPWTGEKAAQQRPVSAQPLNFDRPIPNAIPSPTGAGRASYMVNDLDVKPLTFRTAPAPWDTGTDGTYVDSGV